MHNQNTASAAQTQELGGPSGTKPYTAVEYFDRGYDAHPIIPPDAEISERSTLYKKVGTPRDQRGKTPGFLNRDNKYVSFSWTKDRPGRADLAKADGRGDGVGLLAGKQKDGTYLFGIDADTLGPEDGKIVDDAVTEIFGRSLLRRGRRHRPLYVFRFNKPADDDPVVYGEGRAKIEFLSDGRQFVVEGIHPRTLEPYAWPRGRLPAFDELVVHEPSKLDALKALLVERIPGAKIRRLEPDQGNDAPTVSEPAKRAPAPWVANVLKAMPNTARNFSTRDDLISVIANVKVALPDDPDVARQLVQEFASQYVGPNGDINDPDDVDDMFDSLGHSPQCGGWQSLLKKLRQVQERNSASAAEAKDAYAVALASIYGDGLSKAEPPPPPTQISPPRIIWADPTSWAGRKPKPREWEVSGFVPRFEVTLLYGDGGTGKTLLAHQYATAAAAGVLWLGQRTRKARVMCFFCEDSEDELIRRQSDINAALGVTHADLKDLRIASRKYMDNLLSHWDRNTGEMKRQAVWEQLRNDALEFGAEVIIIDTIADTYSGDELSRAQVNAFVKSCLGRLAAEIGGSVIALGHPSMSGKASGSGTSGSTQWNNAVRSRLYLRYPKGVDKGNIRELEGMKSNYGPKGNLLKIRWSKGAFDIVAASVIPTDDTSVADGVAPLPTIDRAAITNVDEACDTAVFDAVQSNPGLVLSLKRNSQNFAPRLLLMREPEMLAPFSRDEIMASLERLIDRGALIEREVRRDRGGRAQLGLVAIADKSPDVVRAGAASIDAGVFK